MIVTKTPDYPESSQEYADMNTLILGLHENPWIAQKPTPKQLEFLICPQRLALYGGAGGGGKSSALLIGALQFVQVPGYAAILFRKTYKDLSRPEALMSRAHEWLKDTAARWNEDKKQWLFPSGATLSFGHLENENDKFNYKGGAYQFIGFDEATDIPIERTDFVLSRLRRNKGCVIPLRARYATNPGGPAHAALYERFVVGELPFYPAALDDNPYIDADDYRKSLDFLDETTKMQVLKGLWVTDARGRPHNLAWWRGKNRFNLMDPARQRDIVARFTSWDTAQKNENPNAFTARCVFELTSDYHFHLRDVHKYRIQGADVPEVIERDAARWNEDGKLCEVIIEDRSSGSTAIQLLRREEWLKNKITPFEPQPFGDKMFERPLRAATWCMRGCVWLPFPCAQVPWLYDFETMLDMWPDVQFFDVGDAFHQGIIQSENLLSRGWKMRGALEKAA